MEVALDMKLPIVVVNLNNKADMDDDLCPVILKKELVIHIKYKRKAITWTIDNWIEIHNDLLKNNETGARVLKSKYYKDNGI